MMTEISLNILDVAENSTKAGATLVTITVDADFGADQLTVSIEDNGCGMTPEQVERVTDPFFTSRTTRKVGLGVPFFKYAAESTGGSFRFDSAVGAGTTVTATFTLSHIDRMPLGDISTTIPWWSTIRIPISCTPTVTTTSPLPWIHGNSRRF